MMKKALILVSGVLCFCASAFADTVYLTSLEWPPYAGKALPEQGASVAVARAAFKAMGHELVVEFYPWSRAVKLASEPQSKYAGYFPEYYYESKEFKFSDVMGHGPLGLMENKAKPIHWASMADLKHYKIGVVQDYVNTAELDAMIASGEIKSSTVSSDQINVKIVAGGRIDAAVIDANVLHYLLANDNSLQGLQGKVQMNGKLLTDKELFIAFKASGAQSKWLSVYNEGLKKIDVQALMAKYLGEH